MAAFYFILVLLALTRAQEDECMERMIRMREFYCVSQCVGISDNIDPMKFEIRTTPLATNIPCNAFDQKIKTCCLNPPDFMAVPKTVQDDCLKLFPAPADISYVEAYENYILNKWLDSENAFDITTVDNTKKQAVFCYGECLFSKMNWGTDVLKTTDIRALWREKAGVKAYQDIVSLAVNKCSVTVPNVFALVNVNVSGKTCSTRPWMFTQCVLRAVMQYCPLVSGATGDTCKSEQVKLKPCDFFQ